MRQWKWAGKERHLITYVYLSHHSHSREIPPNLFDLLSDPLSTAPQATQCISYTVVAIGDQTDPATADILERTAAQLIDRKPIFAIHPQSLVTRL